MKRSRLLALTLALALALSGCAGYTQIKTSQNGEREALPMSQSLNEQAVYLLALETEKNPGENVILSPLSIEIALAMAANGATGAARDDLETLFGMDVETMNALFGAWLKGEDATLSIANSMWFNETMGEAVDSGFKKALSSVYAAQEGEFKALDAASAGEINRWVSDKTRGKITSIVDQNSLGEDLFSILLNAVYFDGKWSAPFRKEQVEKGEFHAPEGEQDAEFMTQRLKTYFETDQATGFAKSYEDGYEWVAILPKGEDFDLSALDLDAFLDSRTGSYDVDVKLPKFELRYETSLTDTLAQMGLESLFRDGAMDEMLTQQGRERGVKAKVSDVVHKTYMRMYEEGTEAAAVTGVMVMATSAAAPREVKQVFLDRPFAFLILDQNSGQPVFCGYINSLL